VRDERSLVDLLNDILGNLHDIVRSELRLATAEVTDELRTTKSAALGLGIAFLASAFTVLFLLLSAMYALTLVLTTWGAALVVAGAVAMVSVVAFVGARRMLVRRNIAPRTTASLKENLAWAKQSIK
jgi:uncharacterized membrane protein YqjE